MNMSACVPASAVRKVLPTTTYWLAPGPHTYDNATNWDSPKTGNARECQCSCSDPPMKCQGLRKDTATVVGVAPPLDWR